MIYTIVHVAGQWCVMMRDTGSLVISCDSLLEAHKFVAMFDRSK